MGDHLNSNRYPDDNTQYYGQDFSPPPPTFPSSVHQAQYYEQGLREPPQLLPPIDQHTSMQPWTDNHAFGYDSRAHQLQPQDSYWGPANQHPQPHGSGLFQPTPRQWGYNAATQSQSHSDVRDRTPDPNSGVGGWNSHYQPVAPSRRPRTEAEAEAALFQPMPESSQVRRITSRPASPFRNTSRRTSPYPMPANSQGQRDAAGPSSPYSSRYGGQQAGFSQMPTPIPPHIGQHLLPPSTLSQSPPTLRPSRPPERSTRGNLLPSMRPTSAGHTLGASAQRSAWAGRQPSSRRDPILPALFAPSPAEPHRGPKTERTTRPPERPLTANHSHPMLGFSGSHIQEANFTSVGGSYSDHRRVRIQNYNMGPESDPRRDIENRHFLDELAKRSAPGAVANAEARAYAPRCLHKTRTRVLNDLGEWSAAEGKWKDTKLLVLTGPAGHGKTAIMQSFAEQASEESRATDIVVVTFFFKATIPDQNKPNALVTTLAHQVAQHCESFRRRIIAVTRDNVAIFSMTLENQMKHLLINPITESQGSSPSTSFTVICAVDGLDECDGDNTQSRVIDLLHTLSMTPNTRVVLASRPEFPIQSVIKLGLSGMLHIDLNKDYNAADDIRQFTWVRLVEIRDKLLPSIDRVSWPREEDAEQIADYSSGQFILAQTAMRYVDDRRYNPRKRLEEVLALCGGASNSHATRPVAAGRGSVRPLGVLDALFTGILERATQNAYPDLEPERGVLELASLVWILIGLIPSRIEASNIRFYDSIPLWVIEEALSRQSGDLARELSDLHSLLDVPQDMNGDTEISAHHKSFLDFLGDPRRSSHLGNIPEVAEGRFDLTIKAQLSSLTVDDLKNIVLAQPVKPHILHWLHLLCKPETVIESIDPKVWRGLFCSLNAWEMLLAKQWVFVSSSQGQVWDLWNSKMLQMMDEACKRSLDDLLPGVGSQGPLDPPPISDTDIGLLLATLDCQGDENFECEHSEFIPKQRACVDACGMFSSFPWSPAARALAWIWAPNHRFITSHSRVTQPSDTPNSHPQKPSQIAFIVGSAGSGKRELLEDAYKLLPAGQKDGAPEDWMPPVDIIIVPGTDGMSLRSIWMPGTFRRFYQQDTPCNNTDLTGEINLSCNIPASLFQDWIACWETKHKKNMYHPQFLLQGLHLLSPEHQAALLDIISSHVGPLDSSERPPLFITVTSLPTATFASRLHQFSWPRVYYIDLDRMKADVSLLEEVLPDWMDDMPPSKIHRLAQILATSPKPARHLKRLIDHWKHNSRGWANRLDPVLAAPESEAWQLIEEHFGEIPTEDDGGESGDEEWASDEEESFDDGDQCEVDAQVG